jgi:hypothetical protein
MEARDSDIVLCCLLWAKQGLEDDLSAYEDAVLPLIREHGGEVLQRARGDGSDGHPHEVQFYRFASQAAIDAYAADPRRVALANERDRVVARTDVFPVELRS